jgi:hypothetical protein
MTMPRNPRSLLENLFLTVKRTVRKWGSRRRRTPVGFVPHSDGLENKILLTL